MSLSMKRNNEEAVDMNSNSTNQVNEVLGTKHSLHKHDTFKNNHNEDNANPPDSTRLNSTRGNRLRESILEDEKEKRDKVHSFQSYHHRIRRQRSQGSIA